MAVFGVLPEWLIGVILSAMASLLGTIGLSMQKLTHQRIEKRYAEMREARDKERQQTGLKKQVS